jgi:hypothetical protein
MTAYVITGAYPAYTVDEDGEYLDNCSELAPLMRMLTHRLEPGDTITWKGQLSERMLLAANILEEFNTTYSDIYNLDAHWRPSELRREAAHRRTEENPDE